MNVTRDDDTFDVGCDLQITKVTRRASAGGTWFCGTLNGHQFDALVFPEHADCPDWEIGESRISKLSIRRLADRQIVFNWNRGADVPAADFATQRIGGFLACGLADHIDGEAETRSQRIVAGVCGLKMAALPSRTRSHTMAKKTSKPKVTKTTKATKANAAAGECPKGGAHDWTDEDGERFWSQCKEPAPKTAKAAKAEKAKEPKE